MPATPPRLAADALNSLLASSPFLWRGEELSRPRTHSTGFRLLDAELPGGGWPVGALTEIMTSCAGVGELSLAMPLLQSLCGDGRPVAFIRPPHIPYSPALISAGVSLDTVLWIDTSAEADARWAAEQLLRDGATGAVLLWDATRDDRSLRRLQLAAEAGHSFAFLYRPVSLLGVASPAALRLALSASEGGTRVDLVKVRGGGRARSVVLPLRPACL